MALDLYGVKGACLGKFHPAHGALRYTQAEKRDAAQDALPRRVAISRAGHAPGHAGQHTDEAGSSRPAASAFTLGPTHPPVSLL